MNNNWRFADIGMVVEDLEKRSSVKSVLSCTGGVKQTACGAATPACVVKKFRPSVIVRA
jgi:hypothetical protein